MKKKHKLLNKIRQYLNVPIFIYFILLILSLFFISIQLWGNSTIVKSIFPNIGYSLVASVCAAVFIDIGNNIKYYNKQKKQFVFLTYEHYELINNFTFTINTFILELNDIKYEYLSIIEFIKTLSSDERQIYNRDELCKLIKSFLQQSLNESQDLYNNILTIDNVYFSGSFKSNLNLISVYCEKSLELLKCRDINEQRKACDLLVYKIIPLFTKLYPEYYNDFFN
ncbi:MAG: hypothetical protein MJ089_01330 [Ruminococcus sp.]|nr:hypothetical protein [Ruminococcus sp.]